MNTRNISTTEHRGVTSHPSRNQSNPRRHRVSIDSKYVTTDDFSKLSFTLIMHKPLTCQIYIRAMYKYKLSRHVTFPFPFLQTPQTTSGKNQMHQI